MTAADADYDYDRVLIYDGDCPFCSAAASAMRRLDGVGSISWEDDAAQQFLAAVFDDAPFALVLVDREDERIYIGREAARELCERAGVPTLIGDVVGENYERIADAVRTVTGAEGEPDPYHDEIPLPASVYDEYERLATAADSMPLAMSR